MANDGGLERWKRAGGRPWRGDIEAYDGESSSTWRPTGWFGMIDEFVVWSRALTAGEVAALANAPWTSVGAIKQKLLDVFYLWWVTVGAMDLPPGCTVAMAYDAIERAGSVTSHRRPER